MNDNIKKQLLFVCYKQYLKADPEGDPHTFLDWARDEVTDAAFSDVEKEKMLPLVEGQVIRGICEHWKASLPGEPLAVVSDSIVSHLDLLDSKCEQVKDLEARVAELDPPDDKENPSAFYCPSMKAAIAALERAHKKVDEITGYSGGSGNWSAQEDEVRMRFALEHLKKGDCTKNDDDQKTYLKSQLDEANVRAKQYSDSSTKWFDTAADMQPVVDAAIALAKSPLLFADGSWALRHTLQNVVTAFEKKDRSNVMPNHYVVAALTMNATAIEFAIKDEDKGGWAARLAPEGDWYVIPFGMVRDKNRSRMNLKREDAIMLAFRLSKEPS